MQKLSVLFFLFIVCFLQAQEANLWQNIRHSSYTIDNELHLRSEIAYLPDSYTEFYYSQGNGWINQELLHLSGQTFDAIIPVDPAERVISRYRTVVEQSFDGFDDILPDLPDSVTVMMAGYLPADEFPPSMADMSLVALDTVGDIPDIMPDYLDITAQYFSFSASRFYPAISNNDMEFPPGPVWGPYNVYASLIINPETIFADSVFYGALYGQIPMVLESPGLYRFSGLDFDGIQRIGNIEHHIEDNNLIKGVSIDMITNDPYFGAWPNMTNSLIFVPATMQVTLSLELVFVDIGQISLMNFDKYIVEPFDNILPMLSNIHVEYIDDLTLVNLTYFDENGNFPLISEVIIDQQHTHQFVPQTLDFSQPVDFSAVFSGQWSNGMIVFSDNGFEMVEEPIFSSTEQITLPLVSDPQLSVYPNPFYAADESKSLRILLDYSEKDFDNSLMIYDIKGRLVYSREGSSLFEHGDEYIWNARDYNGKQVTSGFYFFFYHDRQSDRKSYDRVLILK